MDVICDVVVAASAMAVLCCGEVRRNVKYSWLLPSDPIRRLRRDTQTWLNGVKSVQLPKHSSPLPPWLDSPSGSMLPRCRGFEITLRHATVSRTPPDEWSACRKDFYLKTLNTHKTQTSVPPAGFESAVPIRERPQIHTSDDAVTGIGFRAVTGTWSVNMYAHSKFVHFCICLWFRA